jgi:hypothetical protein
MFYHTGTGVQLKAKIISSGQGSVQYLSFSKDSDRIAACVGKTIVILKAQVTNNQEIFQYAAVLDRMELACASAKRWRLC